VKGQPRHESTDYDRIFAVVRRIPRGRVATYGQVASLAGLAGSARRVGYALFSLPSTTALPWQRVVNAQGGISLDPTNGGLTQRLRLEREGIRFDARGRISLTRYRWRPRTGGDRGTGVTRRSLSRE
jgi:methylated-DNA-protein-cysteine methyltransferase related protein